MESMSVKEARQRFAKLVNSAGRGRPVAITRRGRAVAQIAPLRSAPRPRLPDLSAFRKALGKPPSPAAKSAATIRHLRARERY